MRGGSFRGRGRLAEGDDLGVGGGVAVAEDSVLAAADDFVLVDDDCAYGDFAGGFGGVGFGDGGVEVVEVLVMRCCRDLRARLQGPKKRAICFGEVFESWPARRPARVVIVE